MRISTVRSRPSKAARSFGYTLAAVVNTALFYLVNVEPGWRTVPFLTDDTRRVLVLFNLSLVVGIVTNLVYVVHDAPRWKALWDLVGNGISLAVLIQVWTVFPFAFDGQIWPLVARTVLGFAIAGTAIAMLVHMVTLTGRAPLPGTEREPK